jgi:hypothetical protein
VKTFIGTVITLAAFITAAGPPACAQDSGWKMPNLNPFAQQPKPPTSVRSAPPTSGWRFPRLWPTTTATKTRPNQPSAWQKMSSGTRNFFSKTADALNPWDDANDQPQPVKPSGRGSAFGSATAKKKSDAKSSSILPSSWWTSEEEEKRPRDVNDFLKQPRPGF